MYTRKKIILSFAGMFFLLLLMMSASLFFGSVLLNPKEILSCLIQNDRTSVTGLLLFHIRIPRMFGAIAAGMGLSCAGVILQTVMNNSLASPNTIGVNSGAGFAVMIGLAIFHGRAAHNAIFAFTGAFLTTLLIFALAYMADSKRTTIILAGITVSSFLSAGINTVKLLSDDITLNLTTFMIGSLSDITTKTLFAPGIAIVIAVIISCFFGSSHECSESWRGCCPLPWHSGIAAPFSAVDAFQYTGRLCGKLCRTFKLRRADCSSYCKTALRE